MNNRSADNQMGIGSMETGRWENQLELDGNIFPLNKHFREKAQLVYFHHISTKNKKYSCERKTFAKHVQQHHKWWYSEPSRCQQRGGILADDTNHPFHPLRPPAGSCYRGCFREVSLTKWSFLQNFPIKPSSDRESTPLSLPRTKNRPPKPIPWTD